MTVLYTGNLHIIANQLYSKIKQNFKQESRESQTSNLPLSWRYLVSSANVSNRYIYDLKRGGKTAKMPRIISFYFYVLRVIIKCQINHLHVPKVKWILYNMVNQDWLSNYEFTMFFRCYWLNFFIKSNFPLQDVTIYTIL